MGKDGRCEWLWLPRLEFHEAWHVVDTVVVLVWIVSNTSVVGLEVVGGEGGGVCRTMNECNPM